MLKNKKMNKIPMSLIFLEEMKRSPSLSTNSPDKTQSTSFAPFSLWHLPHNPEHYHLFDSLIPEGLLYFSLHSSSCLLCLM